MPLVVCDKDPCTHLQDALQKFITVPDGMESFQMVVMSKEKPMKTYFVPLKYCPFCGTRVDEQWVEAFHQMISKRML